MSGFAAAEPRVPSTSAHEAAERRQAARALLASPLLTAQRQPRELALVHRHHAALTGMFSRMLGYQLVVESGFARLVKGATGGGGPVRSVQLPRKAPLDGPGLAVLCLACAALLAPGTGGQILISELVEQIRADAVAAGVTLGEEQAGLRRVCSALEMLVAWGVLAETDGTVEEWRHRDEEALLTVNQAVLPHLLARRLPVAVQGAEELVRQAVPVVIEPRQALRRRLVENPLVRREELSAAEEEVLYRDRADVVRQLEENFGLGLEVRLEGALAFDLDGVLSDVEFPGTGTVRQAALLLIDSLVDGARPAAGQQAEADGALVPSLACEWAKVDEALARLVEQYGRAWAVEFVGDPARLRREVVALLESVSLARTTAGALLLHPAAARYRPKPSAVARAARRGGGRGNEAAGYEQGVLV
ncbi:TIGR02678 family protein [Kitasatospora sp. NPDC058046]|uniref:TIGR02678 family protein n=1 Tax=Kitasatospora sp. NPDC058046 TaxID=3346312 RepID=UPI0036D8A25A